MTLLEASRELRRQARALIAYKPVCVAIIQDLEATAERIRKHSDHLVDHRNELAVLLAEFEKLGQEEVQQHRPTSRVEEWRVLAREFHGVQSCLICGQLHHDFEPADLAKLRKMGEFTAATRGVFAFLLHAWNRANRFDLAETARWDEHHLAAFQRWVTGQTSGFPCRYF